MAEKVIEIAVTEPKNRMVTLRINYTGDDQVYFLRKPLPKSVHVQDLTHRKIEILLKCQVFTGGPCSPAAVDGSIEIVINQLTQQEFSQLAENGFELYLYSVPPEGSPELSEPFYPDPPPPKIGTPVCYTISADRFAEDPIILWG